MPDSLAVRVRGPSRVRRPAAAVLCPPDPLDGHAAGPEWLVEGLIDAGLVVAELQPGAGGHAGLTLWDLVGAMDELLQGARSAAGVDPARIGVLGIQGATPLAMIGASQVGVERVAFLLPWSAEIAARRAEKTGQSTPRDALAKALVELQPLRTLADAPAKPTLLLHASADRDGGLDHSLSIAMALQLDGRPIERLGLAFATPAALFGPEGVDEPLRSAAVAALARFFSSGPRS